jgi:hypothetical protein
MLTDMDSYVVVVNFGDGHETVQLTDPYPWLPDVLTIYTASILSERVAG